MCALRLKVVFLKVKTPVPARVRNKLWEKRFSNETTKFEKKMYANLKCMWSVIKKIPQVLHLGLLGRRSILFYKKI